MTYDKKRGWINSHCYKAFRSPFGSSTSSPTIIEPSAVVGRQRQPRRRNTCPGFRKPGRRICSLSFLSVSFFHFFLCEKNDGTSEGNNLYDPVCRGDDWRGSCAGYTWVILCKTFLRKKKTYCTTRKNVVLWLKMFIAFHMCQIALIYHYYIIQSKLLKVLDSNNLIDSILDC